MTSRGVLEERSSAVGIRPWLAVASVTLETFVVITTEFLPIGLLGKSAACPEPVVSV